MADMFSYTKAAMERAMKVQEVILRAMARKITWHQAAEIIGISDRHMRRWRERYDRRRGQPSSWRVPNVGTAALGCPGAKLPGGIILCAGAGATPLLLRLLRHNF
jgi:hypothetical protein